jgi:hypothetical protein
VLAIAASVASASVSRAATIPVEVFAKANSVVMQNGATVLKPITLSFGQAFKVSALDDNLWRTGTSLPQHEGIAGGMKQT